MEAELAHQRNLSTAVANVAKERQSRNVAPHVARDSSAFAEFLEEGKAKGGAKL